MGRSHLGPAETFAVRPTVGGTGVALLSEVGGAFSHQPAADVIIAANTSVVAVRSMFLASGRKVTTQLGGRLRIL